MPSCKAACRGCALEQHFILQKVTSATHMKMSFSSCSCSPVAVLLVAVAEEEEPCRDGRAGVTVAATVTVQGSSRKSAPRIKTERRCNCVRRRRVACRSTVAVPRSSYSRIRQLLRARAAAIASESGGGRIRPPTACHTADSINKRRNVSLCCKRVAK